MSVSTQLKPSIRFRSRFILVFTVVLYLSVSINDTCFSRLEASVISSKCSEFFSSSKVKRTLPTAFLLISVGAGFYLTSKITSLIPEEYSYLSNIVSFASGMAVVAIGAPIFRKIMPIIDRQAFKLSLLPPKPQHIGSQSLHQIWESLNAHFDVNSQIAINQINKVQDIISFTLTRILLHPDDKTRQDYALAQFIWLANIYHYFFYYISPRDNTTAYTIQMLFFNHNEIDYKKLKTDCLHFLSLEQNADMEYFETLLSSWLDPLISNSTSIPDSSSNSDSALNSGESLSSSRDENKQEKKGIFKAIPPAPF